MLYSILIKYPNANISLILRYAAIKIAERQREAAYRIYITDCLRMITENTAKTAYSGGSYLKERFYNIINPIKDNNDGKTVDEILNEAMNECGLKLIDDTSEVM